MRPVRLTALASTCLVAVAACGSTQPPGTQGPTDGDRPTGTASSTPGPILPPSAPSPGGTAGSPPGQPSPAPSSVAPRAGTAAPHPVKFSTAKPRQDGRKLAITWWSGVEPCNVLDRVAVQDGPSSVKVTLYEGQDPKRPNAQCIDIAVLKTTTVTLRQPLKGREVVDGAGS